MKFEDIIIPGALTIVNGEKDKKDIIMFALSTCQWCKKGKKWLEDNNYSYRFIDVDLLPIEEKRKLKRSLMRVFDVMVRYPFLVTNGETSYAGFNIENWEALLKE